MIMQGHDFSLGWFGVLLIGCGGILFWSAHRTGNRALQWVVVGSYAARALLAVTLYAISYWRLPVFKGLQTAPGFWSFGLDARVYHYFGARIAEAWRLGIDLPDPQLGFEYFAFVAGIYYWIGAQPLYPMIVNCAMAAACGLFAYSIVTRFGSRKAALTAAVLVAWWPSTFIWSAQLLKDPLSWFLGALTLWLVVYLVMEGPAQRSPQRLGVVAACFGLALTVVLQTKLRFYIGSVLAATSVLLFVPTAVVLAWRRRFQHCFHLVLVTAVVVVSAMGARLLDTATLLSVPNPEYGHVRLAEASMEQEDIKGAVEHLERAVELNPAYHEAYLKLGALHSENGQYQAAADVYGALLNQQDVQNREQIHWMIGALMLEEGNQFFSARKFEKARTAYLASLRNRLDSPIAHANLALTYAHLHAFEQADQYVAKALDLMQAEVSRDHILGIQAAVIEMRRAYEAGLTVEEFRSRFAQSIIQQGIEGMYALADDLAKAAEGQRGRAVAQVSAIRVPEAELVVAEMRAFANEFRPDRLALLRRGFVLSGGHSLVDAQARISTLLELAGYLPRALAIGFFAPFPWQWMDVSGSTGVMRVFAGSEMLLFYFLLPSIGWGFWGILRRRTAAGNFILLLMLMIAVPISLVVANLGTLFRLRLLYLMPILLIAALGDPVSRLRWVADKVIQRGAKAAPIVETKPGIALPEAVEESKVRV